MSMSSTGNRAATLTQAGAGLRRRRGFTFYLWQFTRKKPLAAMSGVMVLFLIVVAITSPWITPYDPAKLAAGTKLSAPSWDYIMGTDNLGRDMFSRMILGARISLLVGVSAVVLGTLGGILIGVVTGYFGGKLDMVIQRMVDGLMSIPTLILALVIVAILGPSTLNVILAIGIILAPTNSRVVRGAIMTAKQNVYVDASRAIGCSHSRIMIFHLLPNIMAPILILVSIELGAAILVEASLSFLGLGTQPPTPSWGSTLSGVGRLYMESAPWLAIFPGLMISITVLAFNLFGDGLRDILDPRQRGA